MAGVAGEEEVLRLVVELEGVEAFEGVGGSYADALRRYVARLCLQPPLPVLRDDHAHPTEVLDPGMLGLEVALPLRASP